MESLVRGFNAITKDPLACKFFFELTIGVHKVLGLICLND